MTKTISEVARMGAEATNAKLTPEERSRKAARAARARWAKSKK